MKWNPFRRHRPPPAVAKPRGRKQILAVEMLEKRELLTLSVAPLTPGPQLTGVSYGPRALAALAFADGQASDFQASIDWGEGVTTPGVLVPGTAQEAQVTGSHVYTSEGPYT